MNFQMFKLVLEKAGEPEIKWPTFAGSSKKQESSRKNIYFCIIDYAKAFDCVDHNKLWKTLKEMGIPDHLTCLLRNLYAGQEATVRTGHGEKVKMVDEEEAVFTFSQDHTKITATYRATVSENKLRFALPKAAASIKQSLLPVSLLSNVS